MTFRYDFAPTPFGDALAVFSDDGLVALDLTEAEDPLFRGSSTPLHDESEETSNPTLAPPHT